MQLKMFVYMQDMVFFFVLACDEISARLSDRQKLISDRKRLSERTLCSNSQHFRTDCCSYLEALEFRKIFNIFC